MKGRFLSFLFATLTALPAAPAPRQRAIAPGALWGSISSVSGVQCLLAVANTVFAGTSSGMFRSTDNGDHWSAINSGLTNTNVAALALAADGTLYAGTRGGGVFRSTSNGDTWSLFGATPAQTTVLLTRSSGLFAADGVNCSIFFLSYDGSAASNRGAGVSGCPTALAASGGAVFAATAANGLYRSADEGLSWTSIGASIPSTKFHALAVGRGGRIFAATHDAGVYRSTNAGATWVRLLQSPQNVPDSRLPDIRSLCAQSTGELLAGSENGAAVFLSPETNAVWSNIGSGLPSGSAVGAICATGRYRFAAVDGALFRAPSEFKLFGVDFSPYIGDQSPDKHSQIDEAQLFARMQIVQPYVRWIRSFGSADGLEKSGRVAHALGLQAALGAWISTDLAANETEIANLIAAARAGYGDLLIVGSEVLLRGDVSESALIAYMNRVRAAVPGIRVSTADTYDVLLAHPNVIVASDVVLPNYYPYWQGIAVDKAIASLHSWHQQIIAAANGKPVIVSETGWPSEGNTNGDAVPSLANAADYFENFLSWARANGVDSFYFEAFDEPWKAAHEGPQGAHWGIWDNDGVLKSGFDAALRGDAIADNWSGEAIVGGPGTPSIEFTTVPPYGSFDDLKGQIWHVQPSAYRVAVYIYVGGWWTKPTFANPLTAIFPDGSWTCDITTGGSDQNATQIAAFLVAATYSPPAMSGQQQLPASLYSDSVANVSATRSP